ncbi:WD repeat protein Bub3-like protein, partial [Paraphysoderma sedebokerense]
MRIRLPFERIIKTKSVRLYDVDSNRMKLKFDQPAPVLDGCLQDSSIGYTGGIDKRVKRFDFNAETETIIGTHDAPVRCVAYDKQNNLLITGSWDKTIRLWDPRTNTHVGTYQQPGKVFSMDICNGRLVVGMSQRHVYIYDVSNMEEAVQRRESFTKYQTRCVRSMPNGEGFVASSIEGRVGVEFFDPSPESQAKKYAFKCHRQTIDGIDYVYPVNALAFHPIFHTFATGGGDGVVSVWDAEKKKRIKQFSKYPTSVAALSFNYDGTFLAVASSYTFEEGEKDHAPDSIFIRPIIDSDVKPRVK